MGRSWRVRKRRPVTLWWRRGVLAAVLLAVVVIPLPGGPVTGPQPVACQGRTCHPTVSAQRWTSLLPGTWAVGRGPTGTVPVSGQAYVAVGDGVAVVGVGVTVEAYGLRDGQARWKLTLTALRPGSVIMSVRAWAGVVTIGVAAPASSGRTEIVIDNVTGVELRRYPAALFGGAVYASMSATTVIGPAGVTSFDNGTGKVRWRRPADAGLAWRSDGASVYLADSAGGSLGGAPVMGLRIINLTSGVQRSLSSPAAVPFTGSLAAVVDDVALFSSADRITAYNTSTGAMMWSMRAVVPEGADPVQHLLYLTSATGALLGVDPRSGAVRHSVSGATAGGSAGIYVVRGGDALGLAAGRVTWTAPALPWPHYFADVSGVGGSAAPSGTIVVIAACQRLAPPPAASPGPTATPASPTSPTPAMSSPATTSPATTSPATTSPATTSPATTLPATTLPASGKSTPSPKAAPSRSSRASAAASRPAAHSAAPGASATRSAGPSSPATKPASGTTPASPSTSGTPAPSATASPTPTPTPTPAPPQICASPVLVALSI
jgi:outer membrane protein assembly factor BamB